jgi:hypothetical protein
LVQSIDYNPLISQVSKVVLLKLTHFDAFVPSLSDGGGAPDDSQYNQAVVFSGNITKGENNTNLGNNSSIIGGNENFIAYG